MTPTLAALLPALAIVAPLAAPGPATAQEGFGFGAAARGAACQPDSPRCTCLVTTNADAGAGSLRACAERGGMLVRFQARGPVTVTRPIRVASDTTLDGAPLRPSQPPVTILGATRVTLMIEDASNVVIRNLVFRGAVDAPHCLAPSRPADVTQCGVPILAQGDAHDLLIDHDEFSRCGDKCIAIWAKVAAPGERAVGADRVTISNSRFSDSYYAVLVGASGAIPANLLPARERVTITRDIFDGVFRRSPRAASGATVHLLDNLIENWGRDRPCDKGADYGWAVSVTGGARMLAEGNDLVARPGADRCKLAFTIGERGSDDGGSRGLGHLSRERNLLEDGARDQGGANESVFVPPYAYTVADPRRLAAELARTAGVER